MRYSFLSSREADPRPHLQMDKGLAHFVRNLGLPDLAGKGLSCDNKYIHDSGWGLELKRGLGQGKFVVSQVQRLLCCSPVLEDTSFISP